VSTTDQPAAKEFYSGLFGWEAEDMPVGDGMTYSMMRAGGRDVAAIARQPQQQSEAGVPPMWQSYVSVESADDAAARAGELGATVHMPAFDVLEAGRMAVIQDPQGAFFMVWEPRRHFGAALVNAHGAMTWNELATTDLDAASAFYGDLFGWSTEESEGGPGRYLMLENGGTRNGGIREVMPAGTPPHWVVYFGSDDVDASLAKVEELGGTKVMDPFDISVGRIGVAQDPQGAYFSIFSGELDS
jgi:predicted enzyme related to lactoylglutathione lyase